MESMSNGMMMIVGKYSLPSYLLLLDTKHQTNNDNGRRRVGVGVCVGQASSRLVGNG